MLPYARGAELIRDVYGLAVSPGTPVALVSQARTALQGPADFCAIRSCLDTLRKQGHGMLEVLHRAFAGSPIRPAAWTPDRHHSASF